MSRSFYLLLNFAFVLALVHCQISDKAHTYLSDVADQVFKDPSSSLASVVQGAQILDYLGELNTIEKVHACKHVDD